MLSNRQVDWEAKTIYTLKMRKLLELTCPEPHNELVMGLEGEPRLLLHISVSSSHYKMMECYSSKCYPFSCQMLRGWPLVVAVILFTFPQWLITTFPKSKLCFLHLVFDHPALCRNPGKTVGNFSKALSSKFLAFSFPFCPSALVIFWMLPLKYGNRCGSGPWSWVNMWVSLGYCGGLTTTNDGKGLFSNPLLLLILQ